MKQLIQYLESNHRKIYASKDELVQLPVFYIKVPLLPKKIHEQFPKPLLDFDISTYRVKPLPIYKGDIQKREHD